MVPWCVCGDFKEIMYASKKRGGLPRDDKRMKAFRGVLWDCGLFYLRNLGSWFTWERRNLPGNNIRERLDRGVLNELWLS